MNAILVLKISLRSLAQHKGRSSLTILGIVIGISALIATLAIGKGAAEKMRHQFLALGKNYIEIASHNFFQEGKINTKIKSKHQRLTYHDIDVLKKLCPEILFMSPFTQAKEIVTYYNNNILVTIKGGNEDFIKILDRKLAQGISFTKNHISRVAVLGPKAAKDLFKTLTPLGKTIRIKNIPFTVIGVLQSMERYADIQDPNFDIIIPIKALKKHISHDDPLSFQEIIISAHTKEAVTPLVRSVRKVLRFHRKLKIEDADDFTIFDQASILKAAKGVTATTQLLLLIIAAISLLVGGIGIMNIMLVSVTERTQEIGIRMALGAKSSTILYQFLTEASALCFIGGIFGILLGILAPSLISHATGWHPIVSPLSIIIALVTTWIIGLFFGFYPAYKAAHLNPVEALAET